MSAEPLPGPESTPDADPEPVPAADPPPVVDPQPSTGPYTWRLFTVHDGQSWRTLCDR
jgi:hypothetical protein